MYGGSGRIQESGVSMRCRRPAGANRGFVVLLASLGCFHGVSVLAASDSARPEIPKKYQSADAIILNWEQVWKKSTDGSILYREVKRTLIQNNRAIRAFGDVRIAYHQGYQTVKVLKAQTLCSDGRVVEVPEYGMNEVSPRNSAGWPAFSPIRTKVISFSAIEPGTILEMVYERTTKPGMHRFLEIECRLEGDYPTLVRRIHFPDGKPVREFENLDAIPSEPQALPWREGARHVWYSDCPDERSWARGVLNGLIAAAKPVSAFKSTVEEWAEEATDVLDRADAIRDKLRKRLTIVRVHPALSGDRLRAADKVLASHYASAPEAAALLLSLFRAAGLDAEPFFAVRDAAAGWIDSAVTEYGVKVRDEAGTTYWHVTQGRIRDPGRWGGWKRYDAEFADDETLASPGRFRSPADSRLSVNARVEFSEHADWSADLNIRASGLFVPGTSLRSEAQKKKAVRDLVSRTLPDAELKTFTVTTLSDDVFAVSATAGSRKSLTETDDHIFFEFPKDGPWTKQISFPFGRSLRKTPLRLAGPFRQDLKMTLEFPKGWSVSGRPMSIEHMLRNQRSARQSVNLENERITILRSIEIGDRDVSSSDFGGVRDALNDLRSQRARTVILAKNAHPEVSRDDKP
ncbi:MAG: DUF3857 domain-containing protein [Phycisphaerales bacterium]|nr:DUF3857 domain-containing protein [Phycisphaerales bacterium]